jgi:hypothetical protein
VGFSGHKLLRFSSKRLNGERPSISGVPIYGVVDGGGSTRLEYPTDRRAFKLSEIDRNKVIRLGVWGALRVYMFGKTEVEEGSAELVVFERSIELYLRLNDVQGRVRRDDDDTPDDYCVARAQ